MRIVIDSISDKIARVEFGGTMVEIPSCLLPDGCKEGDVLGFVKLDNSEILKEGQSRLDRMKAMSSSNGNSFDL
ncbi:MAG: DUF3006 domain-containing protein [Proteobacteria bacterium]|nr:DUF3006 domain-containing protein [Pseudomonadota bacterium]